MADSGDSPGASEAGELPYTPPSPQQAGGPPKRRRWWPWVLLAAVCTAGVIAVAILTPTWILNKSFEAQFTVERNAVHMAGSVDPEALKRFREVLAKNPGVAMLVLSSVQGGSDNFDDVAFGREVRKRKLSTHIPESSEIEGAGVTVFLGGVNRTMEVDTIIATYSWETRDGRDARELPRNSPEHRTYLRYFNDMLGGEAFYWFVLKSAPHDDWYEMTTKEIDKYGLLTERIRVGENLQQK